MFLVDWPGGSWEATARIAIGILAVYLVVIWAALVFWTYRDIRQRSRDPIVQTVAILVVLFFFLPGHWVYLVLRPRYTLTELYERSLEEEALLQELEDQKGCPNCKRRVHDQFLVCPSCRTQLKEPCRNCSQPLSYAWVVCPFCGAEKPPRTPQAPPRAPQRAPVVGGRPAEPVHRAQPRQQATMTRTATPPPPPPPARTPVVPPSATSAASRSEAPPAHATETPSPAQDAAVGAPEREIGSTAASTADEKPAAKPRRDPFASSTPPGQNDAQSKGNSSKQVTRNEERAVDAAD